MYGVALAEIAAWLSILLLLLRTRIIHRISFLRTIKVKGSRFKTHCSTQKRYNRITTHASAFEATAQIDSRGSLLMLIVLEPKVRAHI